MSASDRALSHSRNAGIDECEITIVKRRTTTIRITDSEITEIKQNFDRDYGIRLVRDKKIASAQIADEKDIEDSIDHAFEASQSLRPREFWGGLPHKADGRQLDGTFDERLERMSGTGAADIAQGMINSASDEKIDAITGSLNIVSEYFEIANSNGLRLNDKATYISGIINAESGHGAVPVSGIGHASCRTLSNFSAERVGADARYMCVESINPEKIDSGKYSIIFEPYSVGELLAFVVASNFSLKTFSEKRSCFADKLDEEIGVGQFSLMDDPHIPEGIGTRSVDDEGVKTQKKYLVENGVFRNTFSNLFDGYKEGRQSTGNASRPGSPMGRSSEPIPISAPHNLRISPGDMSQEDMIKDTRHGLLVGRLWYTYAVNPIRGDFSCTARSGIRVIRDGEISGPGRSVRIIHNLPAMIKNISGIGNNQRNVIQWASLPSVAPTIRAEGITVNSI